MSITIRPEREQAEHDRLIHFLQSKYDKYDVVANPGDEQNAAVKIAARPHFPDLVLNSDKKLAGVVEIETAASVNRLETMHKWVPFSRARVPFHLYVPVQGYDTALRLVESHQVKPTEIWTYRPAIEGFDLVRMYVDANAEKAEKAAAGAGSSTRAAKSAGKPAVRKPSSAPARSKAAGKAAPARPAARTTAGKSVKAKANTTATNKKKTAAAPRKQAKRPAAVAKRAPARTASKSTRKKAGDRSRR